MQINGLDVDGMIDYHAELGQSPGPVYPDLSGNQGGEWR